MRRLGWVLIALLVQGQPVWSQSKSSPALEKIKSLIGAWEGRTQSGKTASVKYEVISGGSVIMETLAPEGEASMVTMYHMDGDRLMMTHYCGAGNQPRMTSTGLRADGNQIAFEFRDATNLPSLDAGHMARMILTWKDSTHVNHSWTWVEKGKPDQTEVFEFVRRK